jgi:hypothetical protein
MIRIRRLRHYVDEPLARLAAAPGALRDPARRDTLRAAAIVALGLIAFGVWAGSYWTFEDDWNKSYRPAALLLLAGRSPYEVPLFYNPPWTLLAVLPFALLPPAAGRAAFLVVSLVAYGYAGVRFGARPRGLLLLLLSPPVLFNLYFSNVEWLVLLGVLLPPAVGLIFVTIKPQVGMLVAVVWIVGAWRRGGWRAVARCGAPFAVLLALSLLVYGWWPLTAARLTTASHNFSFWPWSLPVGLYLAWRALRDPQDRIEKALAGAPLLSPYVALMSWVGPVVALLRHERRLALLVAAMWVYVVAVILTGLSS